LSNTTDNGKHVDSETVLKPKVVGRPWQKGQSGNPAGWPKKDESLKYWLQQALTWHGNRGKSNLQKVVEKVRELAGRGDMRAIEFIWDGLEGKPVQGLRHEGLHQGIQVLFQVPGNARADGQT
jgi:hypothetical protein